MSETCEYYLNATGVGRFCIYPNGCLYNPPYHQDLSQGFGKTCIIEGNLEKIPKDIRDKADKNIETLVSI